MRIYPRYKKHFHVKLLTRTTPLPTLGRDKRWQVMLGNKPPCKRSTIPATRPQSFPIPFNNSSIPHYSLCCAKTRYAPAMPLSWKTTSHPCVERFKSRQRGDHSWEKPIVAGFITRRFAIRTRRTKLYLRSTTSTMHCYKTRNCKPIGSATRGQPRPNLSTLQPTPAIIKTSCNCALSLHCCFLHSKDSFQNL